MLARYDLSFDICVYHPQLGNAVDLVRRCPDVRFILDHIGKPGIRDGLIKPWRTQIRELAALPNVSCKISGVITEAGASWTREQLRPYLEHALDSFGFERVMFASDWPVAEQTHRYGDWVEILEWVVAGCSEQERKKLFRENAIAYYRLGRA